jgi:hypothetical protein
VEVDIAKGEGVDPEATVLATTPEDVDLARVRRARAARRFGVTLLVIFLAGGLAGLYGVRSREVTATGNGYELTVGYAAISRPGLAAPWSLTVRKDGGFGGQPVSVQVSSEYIDLLDDLDIQPEPSTSRSASGTTVWEFEPPDGDTLEVSLDARVGPGVQRGKRATAAVLVDGNPVVRVAFRTVVMP